MDAPITELKNRLTQALSLRNMTQQDLSDATKIPKSSISQYISGYASPKSDRIHLIAKALQVTETWLLGYDVPMIPDFSNITNLSRPAARPIPILGTICAGDGIDCIEEHDGYFFVDNSIKADYCLTIKGDSMIDAGIKNGDKAFIRKTHDYENGKIYAVVLKGENQATLKRFHQDGNTVVLSPCNPDYQTIITKSEDICIVGECVGTYHVMK